jgi:LysR family hca operon transcriptional activator
VAFLPAYARNFLPWSVISRPIKGDAPTIDLVAGYHRANASPTQKLFLSRLDELIARASKKVGTDEERAPQRKSLQSDRGT